LIAGFQAEARQQENRMSGNERPLSENGHGQGIAGTARSALIAGFARSSAIQLQTACQTAFRII
jgi:hypothetical protein